MGISFAALSRFEIEKYEYVTFLIFVNGAGFYKTKQSLMPIKKASHQRKCWESGKREKQKQTSITISKFSD